MALHNTTEKVLQFTTTASRTAKQVLGKDPKLGPLLMVVAGTGEQSCSATSCLGSPNGLHALMAPACNLRHLIFACLQSVLL